MKNKTMHRSNYTYKIGSNYLFITDLNIGGKSVTNDIENVLDDISKELNISLDNFKILYMESDGVVDGILTSNGEFKDFKNYSCR